ncbi:MAG: alginate export family protein [Thermoplasmata archaeon]
MIPSKSRRRNRCPSPARSTSIFATTRIFRIWTANRIPTRPTFSTRSRTSTLGPDWRLSLGGELRARLEDETNKAFGATRLAQDTFFLHRYFLHADLKYRKAFRVFSQFIAAFDDGRDLPPRPGDENRTDLNQLFFDARFLGEESPWTLRVGRQELSYGKERRVAVPNWSNTRRRFDGFKVLTREKSWDLDFFYLKPVFIQRDQSDRFDEKNDFYGFYFAWKGIERHGLEVYFFAVDDTGIPRNPNGRIGDKSEYTIGYRFWGKTPPWDYETESAYQWGRMGG